MSTPDDTPTSSLPEGLRRQALEALSQDGASALLARIAYWLTLLARNDYAEAGQDPAEAYARLRTNNERLIVLAGQLRKMSGDNGFGYPNDAFLDVLAGKPGASHDVVERALEKSLKGQ